MLKIPVKKFWLILLGLTLFFMIWVNQTIRSTKLTYEIGKIEKEIKIESTRLTQLKMDLDRAISLETIEMKAKELGFEIFKDDNKVLLEVPKS